ncbi:MAG: hypothetical protein HOY71_42100 [Nonomuraea sp.]|nr:hypothetical protein [Nonomuraea sp.]
MLKWHRPLMIFAGLMTVCAAVFLVLILVDHRQLDGVPLWAKPLKFSISFALYSFVWAWLLQLQHRARRLSWWMGTALVAAGVGETALIFFQAARWHRSHFNQSTELDGNIWKAMGITIGVLMVAQLVAGITVALERQADAVTTWTVRLGLLISTLGLGAGGFMLGPKPGENLDVAVGAHTVGLQDGGPGLPLLGWSTAGGDLRIPHFVGMHALQLLPLLALALAALARRYPRLEPPAVRLRLVFTAAALYGGIMLLTLWQALRGQPLIHPDAATLAVAAALAVATAAAVWKVTRA